MRPAVTPIASIALLLAAATTAAASMATSMAHADTSEDDAMRSLPARNADLALDVSFGAHGFGANGDSRGGVDIDVRFVSSFADPKFRQRRGFVIHDELWVELGGLGVRGAYSSGTVGAGYAMLPGVRLGSLGLFFGAAARAQAWFSATPGAAGAFSTTSVPFEGRIEVFEHDAPRVALTGWYAPWPSLHRTWGGRVDYFADPASRTSVFVSFDYSEGVRTDWRADHTGLVDRGGAWDARFGVAVRP